MQRSKLRLDVAVAVVCSLVLCLSTTRVMVGTDWLIDSNNSEPRSIIATTDSEGLKRVSTIEISTPMVVVKRA